MKKAGLALVAVLVLGASAAAITWAAAGDPAVIHACVTRGSNLVRIPADGDACRHNETAVDWNAQGPAGPTGPKGDTGAQGPAGTAGEGPAEPNTRVVGFLHAENTHLGTIDGDATENGHENWISVVGFDSDTSVPMSTGSGSGGITGRVQFKPFVITKPIDKATPKLFQALVTNDVLDTVQLDLVRPDGSGGDQVFYSVKLTDARVSEIHQLDAGKQDGQALEEVSFVFDKIEITEGDGTATGGGNETS